MTFTKLKKEFAKYGLNLSYSHRKYELTKIENGGFNIIYLVEQTLFSRVHLEANKNEIIRNFQTEWPRRLKCNIETYISKYPDVDAYKKDLEKWHQIYDWIETDSDSCQHVRKISDMEFQLIEIGSNGSGLYEVYTDTIDVVADYIEGLPNELKIILETYGYSGVEAVREEYKDTANQIIAECIFEYYGSFQAESIFSGAIEQCEKHVKEFVQKNSNP